MKLISTLILFFCFLALPYTQDSEHMTFKGVPIDGKLTEFIVKMKDKGLEYLATEDGMAFFQGDFAGYKSCYIGAHKMPQKDIVYSVVVLFPECETWSNLSSNYYDLKKMLSIKYGEPVNVVEEFDSYSQPKDDNSRMHEVGMDNCKYYTIWDTNRGEIQLSIEHDGYSKKLVKVMYLDKINMEIMKGKAIGDL